MHTLHRVINKVDKRRRAAFMRRNPTAGEKALQWLVLLGYKRQVVINGYIADFYHPIAKVIVEVDGDSHKGRRQADKQRDRNNRKKDIYTLRISNRRAVKGSKSLIAIETVLTGLLWYLYRTLKP